MFENHAKTIQRIAPQLQKILIIDPQPASARFVASVMRDLCRPETVIAETNEAGLALAAETEPQLIFAELLADEVDGVDFTRRLRRSELPCRKAPVILVTGQATATAILSARDAGVHEFLRKPFTVKDLVRRLEAVALHPREWVEAVDYIGPDRRRFNSADYKGPLKRQTDQPGTSESARIGQALKILRSALGAIDRDPPQALRAMLAQTTELQVAAATVSDARLAMCVSDLHRYLFETASGHGRLDRAEVERRAAPLLAYLP